MSPHNTRVWSTSCWLSDIIIPWSLWVGLSADLSSTDSVCPQRCGIDSFWRYSCTGLCALWSHLDVDNTGIWHRPFLGRPGSGSNWLRKTLPGSWNREPLPSAARKPWRAPVRPNRLVQSLMMRWYLLSHRKSGQYVGWQNPRELKLGSKWRCFLVSWCETVHKERHSWCSLHLV